MSIEKINEAIEDAQHRIVQAMGDLVDAFKMAEEIDNDDLYDKIKAEWQHLNSIDDHLGDIKRIY